MPSCFLFEPTLIDHLLHAGNDERRVELLHVPVAKLHRLAEVVARVHVHQRQRQLSRVKGLSREVRHHDRVFAGGEEQRRLLELGHGLADDEDRLGFELLEVGQLQGLNGSVHDEWVKCKTRFIFRKWSDRVGNAPNGLAD